MIFNNNKTEICLNPCFDRIYFQFKQLKNMSVDKEGLNPCFDRIYFQ